MSEEMKTTRQEYGYNVTLRCLHAMIVAVENH